MTRLHLAAVTAAALAATALAAAPPALAQSERGLRAPGTGVGEGMQLEQPGGIPRDPAAGEGLRAGERVAPDIDELPRERDLFDADDDLGQRRVEEHNLASGPLEKAEDLRDNSVVGAAGERVGDVEDIALGPSGQRRYLVVGTAGFLDLGDSFVPVPEHQFRRIDRETVQLLVPEDLLAQAPRYPKADIVELAGERWPDEIDAWWRKNVEQAQGPLSVPSEQPGANPATIGVPELSD